MLPGSYHLPWLAYVEGGGVGGHSAACSTVLSLATSNYHHFVRATFQESMAACQAHCASLEFSPTDVI